MGYKTLGKAYREGITMMELADMFLNEEKIPEQTTLFWPVLGSLDSNPWRESNCS